MLPDGIHTLAYGHKDVQQTLEADHDPPSFDDQVIPRKEATRLGLHWQRRHRLVLELRFDPTAQVEETEEDARAARKKMRGRVADLINQIPNQKYQFLPNENEKTISANAKERRRPATKYRRVQLGADSDTEEQLTQASSSASSDEEEITERSCSSRKRPARADPTAFLDDEVEVEGSDSDSDDSDDNDEPYS